MSPDLRRLRDIHTLRELIPYLRDDLGWPIDQEAVEDDVTFEWAAADLGIEEKHAVKIKDIKQLRPLKAGQPWGIFFVNFEKKHLPVVVMRKLLSGLAVKKRATAGKASQAAWKSRDLLFISAYGEDDKREISFAHFSEDPESPGDIPTLRVLGWDDDDTGLKLDYVAQRLKSHLAWPADEKNLDAWRAQWAAAFVLRNRQVINTSKDLAIRLADLARRIRHRANLVMKVESERGTLRKLHTAFKQALIHDLTEDAFADMYAQTITYGLFSSAVSRPAGVSADTAVQMVPVTNPFLKELLQAFLTAGGRKDKLDFDELGIQEVVELLNSPDTHMDAVLRDFGNRNPDEDPVIHFYEHFLAAYDKQLKVQRGVFYTPKPVVSYIVRSVHELLQTEFGLEDGLASTVTWGEMLKKHTDLKLPPLTDEPGEKRTISPDEFFVQILDPATGTATFPVEVIEVISQHLKAKWAKGGLPAMPHVSGLKSQVSSFEAYWNLYVPRALLPRLHAFELMMAPSAVQYRLN